MREIKFRQFIDGQFHYWGFLEKGIFVGPVSSSSGAHANNTYHMQFTGLKDKNGRDIYEGDVVKSSYTRRSKYVLKDNTVVESTASQKYRPKLIEWKSGGFNLKDGTHLEVIGNIYENPELLNP